MKVIKISMLFYLSILLYMPLSTFGNIGYKEKLFDGELYLSNLPVVGQEATITLDLTAVSGDYDATTIVFRMPDGVVILGDPVFTEPFYAKGMRNQYKTAIKVLKEGVYALQASVYSEISGNRQKAQHFYTYLTVTRNRAWVNDKTNYLTASEKGIDAHITNLAPPELARAMGTLSIQGNITYYDDNLTRPVPIRNLKVLLIEVNQDNSPDILGTTQTDDDGFYIFNGANIPELDDGSTRNLQTRIVFENEFIKIYNADDRIYSFDMPLMQNVSAGLLVSDYFLNEVNQQRSLGHIFNTILRSYVFLQQKLGWRRKSLPLVWPFDGKTSNYYYVYNSSSGILILEAIRVTVSSQWDRTTLYHEYGHSVMMALYGYNQKKIPKSDYQIVHSARTVSDPEFAMSEGWAEFFEALIEDNAFNFPQYSNRDTPNIEYNDWWRGKEENNTDGEIVEGAVASILWDIVDTQQSIDENPNLDDDDIDGMIAELWDLMAKDKPKKIRDLWDHWQENGYGQVEALKSIFIDNGVSVTIKPVNQPPTAIPMTAETDEDNEASIQLAGSDPEGNALIYTVSEQPKNGVLAGNAPSLTYTPNENYNGADSFSFIVNDGNADSQPATVNITVKPVNDAPKANPKSITVDEDKQVIIVLDGNDIDNDALSFTIDQQPTNGELSGTPPQVTYMPKKDFNGNDSFSFSANDGELDSRTAVVSIEVNPVNDPPSADTQSLVTDEGMSINIRLTGNDIDGDTLTFRIDTQPANGKLSGEMPDLVYEPNYGFSGVDSFTFAADDGVATSEATKIEIAINSTPNPFDVNKDGMVDILDIVFVSMYFGKTDFSKDQNPDINRDGKVDGLDLGIVMEKFGTNTQ